MSDFEKIAVINVGWSDDYQGSPVVGAFKNLQKKIGHERFNFLPGPDGRYFGYAAPIGEQWSPPTPDTPEGWLVFVVSKRRKGPGLYLVGWYENAAFLCAYKPRPDAADLGLDSDGEPYLHTLVASNATAIPPAFRTRAVKGDHLKRSFAYLQGNGENDNWRKQLARKLLRFRDQYLAQDAAEADLVDTLAPAGISADTNKRKEVEEASVEAVKRHFKGWQCRDRQRDKCGYDLLFRQPGAEMHVEVKGTQAATPHFFISSNEFSYAEEVSQPRKRADQVPEWRLAMVTDALGKDPKVKLYDFAQMKEAFRLEIYTWHATVKN